MSAQTPPASSLPGFTVAETIIMAAAFFHARSADVDYEKVCAHVGSKSTGSVRERLRVAKKKTVEIEGTTTRSAASVAPAGGIDKKATGKVNKSPRKVGNKAASDAEGNHETPKKKTATLRKAKVNDKQAKNGFPEEGSKLSEFQASDYEEGNEDHNVKSAKVEEEDEA